MGKLDLISIDFVVTDGDGGCQVLLNGYFDDVGLGDMVSIVGDGDSRAAAIAAVRRIAARMGELGEQAVALMEVRLAAEAGTLS